MPAMNAICATPGGLLKNLIAMKTRMSSLHFLEQTRCWRSDCHRQNSSALHLECESGSYFAFSPRPLLVFRGNIVTFLAVFRIPVYHTDLIDLFILQLVIFLGTSTLNLSWFPYTYWIRGKVLLPADIQTAEQYVSVKHRSVHSVGPMVEAFVLVDTGT